jgi:8-oxo-dGTP diphosphatase
MKKRVRAIIIKNGQLLSIERINDKVTFWALPGGGVEDYDEDETSALKRECLEEVSLDVDVVRSIWVREFNGQIEEFYLCKVLSGEAQPGNGPEYMDAGYAGHHIPTWLSLNDLHKYDLKPVEMKNYILKNKDIYEK